MKLIRKSDLILIAAVLLSALLFSLAKGFLAHGSTGKVNVYVNNKLFGSFSLDQDSETDIYDDSGYLMKLVISDNSASVVDASCPDKLCVKQQSISVNNESICCLPNNVLIIIKAEEEGGEYDAISK